MTPEDYNVHAHAEGTWATLPDNWPMKVIVMSVPGSTFTRIIVEGEQRMLGAKVDGKLGSTTVGLITNKYPPVTQVLPFTDAIADSLIAITSRMESGGKYWACNRDGEYEGHFDKPGRPHRASKHGRTPIHIGLSWGVIQFTQDGGTLGKVLQKAFDKDPETFKSTFGDNAEKMLKVVTAKGQSGLRSGKLRSSRVQKVGGADLWQAPWLSMFKAAGKLELFQWAQRWVASTSYMSPAFKHAKAVHLNSERALAVLFDRTVQLGSGGMRSLLARAGVGSDEPLNAKEIREHMEKLDKYTEKYKWHHRVVKLMSEPGLRDWILLT